MAEHSKRLLELIDRLREDRLSNEQVLELESLILNDDEARQEYVRATNLIASLHWLHAEELAPAEGETAASEKSNTNQFPGSPFRKLLQTSVAYVARPTPLSITVAATVVGLFVATLAFIAVPAYRRLTQNGASPTPHVVARITGLSDAQWGDGQATNFSGMHLLSKQTLDLQTGLAEITFKSSARLIVTGPAQITVVDENKAYLEYGQLTAEVPPAARGFTVQSPVMITRDLGTEFAIAVAKDGQSTVHVDRGTVEVDLQPVVGERSAEPRSWILKSGESLRLLTDGRRSPVSDPHALAQLKRQMPPQAGELRISPEYAQAVTQAGPVAYWRFGGSEVDAVDNAISQRHVLQNTDTRFQHVGQGNLAASFPADGRSRHLLCNDLNELSGDAYTIELWLQPLGRKTGSMALVALGTADVGDSLLLSLRGAADGSTIRFLHRSPAGNTGGIDLYADQPCQPGQWHHIAAVMDQGRLHLYQNGKLAAEGSGAVPLDEDATHLILGRLRTAAGGDGRQFAGRFDEVAIYDRALTPEEITSHVDLVRQH